jgi:hypothetical protein
VISLLWLYILCGMLLVILSLPLIAEKVRPNPYYGFRFLKTLDDPAVWYEVNKYAGKRLLWIGIIYVLTAVGLYRIPNLSVDSYALSCLVVFIFAFTVAMIQSMRYMKTMA